MNTEMSLDAHVSAVRKERRARYKVAADAMRGRACDPASPEAREVRLRIDRFVVPEPNTGCHLWTGRSSPRGYGRFSLKTISQAAHRAAWEATNGRIPEGLYVLHRCDTPACVNVGHLFLGTQLDNMRDMLRKGRDRLVGSKNHNARLSDAVVREMRTRFDAGGVSLAAIGRELGISKLVVQRVVRRGGWRHVDGGSAAAGPRAKFSEAQVREIRSRRARGETALQLAAVFGSPVGRIYHALKPASWRGVDAVTGGAR